MNSNDVRQKIAAALAHEQNTHAMKKRLMSRGLSLELQRIALEVVEGYLNETPDLMDVADSAAAAGGIQGAMRPLFDAALQYWEEGGDVIPDRLGLYGLLDDAYLTRTLLEKAATEVCSRTGHPLFSVDLATSNGPVRDLLGSALTAELDEHVNAVVYGERLATFYEEMTRRAPQLTVPLASHGAYLANMREACRVPERAREFSGALGFA
jgi:hypothetical protein